MAWRIELNPEHVRTVRRLLWQWVWFVVVGLVLGWHLGPRLDEVLFVLFVVPLTVLGGYIALCFAVAVLKSLWPLDKPRWSNRWARRLK